MISRTSVGRVQHGLISQCFAPRALRRGLAAAASGSFSYETAEHAGVKYASRDIPGPTSTLAVIARAGTRYQIAPGITEGLEKFAFKTTERRSALRITREAELLGGELIATHSRENLIVGAKFLRDDLPYFAELLAEVINQTRYTEHELHEQVMPIIKLDQKSTLHHVADLAMNSAHGLAFHRGLGSPLHPTSSTPLTQYLTPEYLQISSAVAYSAANIAVVANGIDHADLSKWMKEFFSNVRTPEDSLFRAVKSQGSKNTGEKSSDFENFKIKNLPQVTAEQTKYFGGEERIAHDGGNAVILGFPGSSSFTGKFWKPEIAVLAALLGGKSTIKWSPGFSLLANATADFPGLNVDTMNLTYSDAGLLCVRLTGSALAIRQALGNVVDTIKGLSSGEIDKEDFNKAVANAKFTTLSAAQETAAGIEATGSGLIEGGRAHQFDEVAKSIENVSEAQLKAVAKTLLEGKATVSTVGDLYVLPYAEELDLHV